jgi:histidyl-tRNA synthetase
MASDVKVKPRLPKGMRDILPDKMILRQYVIGVIQGVFEEFGFEPLLTPAIEMSATLMGKYGPDAERLIYDTRHRGGQTIPELPPDVDAYIKKAGLRVSELPSEELSLRYDLSVPLCRVMAMYPDLPKPFKRYQISPVWRAERPQKGRYREFWQCDADTVGGAGMLADAETITVIYEILNRLGFRDFVTKINNRKILTGVGEFSGLSKEQLPALYRSIDKLDKIGLDGVRTELQQNAIADDVIARMLDLLQVRGTSRAQLAMLEDRLASSPIALQGIAELDELIGYLDVLGIPTANYQVDFAMVRGLEYYTGPIFETVVEKPKIGSITGGGRFDNLVGMFLERSFPATGTTIGIERIIDVMDELKMYPPEIGIATAQVLVTIFQPGLVNASLKLANALRKDGVKVQLYPDPVALREQISYASRKGIPYIAILGPDEAANGQVTLRKSRDEQKRVAWSEAAALVKRG